MAFGRHIRTFFDGRWHDGDVPVMRAADHGLWQGSSVFDGARRFEGMTPDLGRHCARLNRSAEALMLRPTMTPEAIEELAREGLDGFAPGEAVYIRPMYWGIHGSELGLVPSTEETGFAICLETVPMPDPGVSTTVTTTRFRRPVMADSVCDAKAGCLYPNNARMLAEARAAGFGNALACDAMGNLAESATSNVFLVRDGEVFTPIANGTFLAGITRARHIANLRADGVTVHETVLTLDDARAADEMFLSGNLAKILPVTAFDDRRYEIGPVTRRAREMYWDWARSCAA